MTIENESVQYLPAESRVASGATNVKERVSAAGDRLKDALPDAQAVKSVVNGAVEQAKEALPDPEAVKQEFLAAAHRMQQILPDGDDLKATIARVAQEVRDDPDIHRHLVAAADVASERLEASVGTGIDAAAGTVRRGVEKAGLEDLGYVADRLGEIVKEGMTELVEGTKDRAIDALPEPAPYTSPTGGPAAG